MKKTKILALVLCAVLCVSLASCSTVEMQIQISEEGANALFGTLFGGSANTGNTAVPANNTPAAPVTNAPAAPATQASSDSTTAAPSGDTPAAEATTAAPSGDTPADEPATAAPSNGTPTTKEEIIRYYVTAYNKIATDSSSIVRNYDNTSQYNNILNVNGNGTLESLAKKLMDMFMGPTEEDIEYSINDLPPKTCASISISPEQIGNATIQDNGDTYTVTLQSTGSDASYEIDAQPGQNSAGVVGPLLRTEDVTGAAGSFVSFEGLHAYYATCTVTAVIDKATGHITHFDFNSPCILHFDRVTAAKIVKVNNCDIGLLFEQRWTINY